ncbi:hypothetical protein R3I93_006163 [Phoxinus phoxinus]|uniref:Uncharacterized protein n=1 Tax=Phoxinus phoxinus TaxID=58324 RepID=A0AAN9DCL8_9TELE
MAIEDHTKKNRKANLLKLVGQAVVVSPSSMTKSHMMRMWKQLLLF